MRGGAGRDLGRGPGAARSCCPGAHVSPLPRAAATLGLRPNPFAALLWWWTRVATTATGPLHQLQSDPRAAARVGAPTSRLHDRPRRTGAAGPVSYTHLRAHETGRNLVCRLLLEK